MGTIVGTIYVYKLNKIQRKNHSTLCRSPLQQWGYYESTRSEYDLIYPIAFVSATFCITAIGVEDGHGFAVIRSVSKTQARISNDTYTNYWIVIGM